MATQSISVLYRSRNNVKQSLFISQIINPHFKDTFFFLIFDTTEIIKLKNH